MKKNSKRKLILCLFVAVIIISPVYLITSNYIKNRPKLQYTFNQGLVQKMVIYPNAQFAVMSDLHYYDNSLGTTGTAFKAAMDSDRKLLKDSADLLELAINNILKSDAKFVLIPGDLTKDGELICHQQVGRKLSKLIEHGIKVYVIPGNHDINNPGALKYVDEKTYSISNITGEQFTEIYNNFGYGSAIYRDNSSLSYVAEPVDNLWLIAIDSCRYKENKPGSEEIISGRLSQSQEEWLEDMLKKAQQNGKAVIVMEHHGLVEHWVGQSKLHPEYLVRDYKYVSKLLASYNVRLAFTGHYHAQDISLASFNNKDFIFDVETGSLITPPCATRFCTLTENKIKITSDDLIEAVHPNSDFIKNSKKLVFDNVVSEAYKVLRNYHVPEKSANYIADYVGSAFVAHYSGDENISLRPAFDEKKLGFGSRIIYSREKYVINGLWKDLTPNDNNVTLDLGKR